LNLRRNKTLKKKKKKLNLNLKEINKCVLKLNNYITKYNVNFLIIDQIKNNFISFYLFIY